MKEIYIPTPYIEDRGNGLYRLVADINVAGSVEQAFLEVEEAYKDYLVTERSDAFVLLAFPIAIREGYDIRCEAPITEMFLHNVEEFLIPSLVKGDARAKNFNIIVPTEREALASAGGVATAVTCGVDSTYTIMQYTQEKYNKMKLSHLFVGSLSMDLWAIEDTDNLHEWEEKYATRFKRYNYISEYTGLPLVKVYTNFVHFVTKRRIQNPTYRHVENNGYITLSGVLCLEKMFDTYIFSAGHDLSEFSLENNLSADTAFYDLLLTFVLSHSGFRCFAGGGGLNRIKKLMALTEYPLAKKVLHPCFKDTEINCSEPGCSKCMRDLFVLDYYDKLDEMSEVYDIQRYKENVPDYIYELMRYRKNSFFIEPFEMIKKKYPHEVEKAEKKYERNTSPVSRDTYNTILKAYNAILLMLSDEDPRATLCDWLEEKNIKKLYFTGNSKFGNQVREFICDKVEIVTWENGNVNDCDAVFIENVSTKEILEKKKAVLEKLSREMDFYTINDVINIFKKES